MTVIAMTQEMGSLGKDVAQKVADQLGLTVIRNEISEQVAGKLKKRKSAIRRYMEGHASLRERFGTSRSSLAIYSAEEVFETAAKGNTLIRGWGANYLLRPVSHVLCVRICAPMEQRVNWLMQRLDTDDREFAEDEIQRSDAAHAANIRSWFHKAWGDPLDYDLVINTGQVSVDTAAGLVVQALKQPEFQPTDASRQKLADLTLEAHTRSALRRNTDTEDVSIDVRADNGTILLSGIVVDDKEREACEKVALGASGVKKVDNQLTTMTSHKVYR